MNLRQITCGPHHLIRLVALQTRERERLNGGGEGEEGAAGGLQFKIPGSMKCCGGG